MVDRSEEQTRPTNEASIPGASVLVIEDEDMIRDFLGCCLQAAGYQVYEAGTGPEIGPSIKQNRPKVIVSDLEIPGTSGENAIEDIRSYTESADDSSVIGVVVMTASTELIKLDSLIKDCVRKPFHPQEIINSVGKVLAGPNPALTHIQ